MNNKLQKKQESRAKHIVGFLTHGLKSPEHGLGINMGKKYKLAHKV